MISDPKDDLRRYIRQAREAMAWKIDGLPEYEGLSKREGLPEGVPDYDVRRPVVVPSATNLLGLTGAEPVSTGA